MDTILITGGKGRIGTALAKQFKGVYRTRSYDYRPSPEADESVEGNITDIPTLIEACRGVRAIVHLAGIPSDAPFDLLLDANIRGTYCVYEAARLAGVGKVVFASTNHVSGMWEQAGVAVTADAPIRPDSLYAVSKAAGEALARFYADAHGIASVCLRIGGFNPTDVFRGFRSLYLHISHRDIAQLTDKAIRSDVLFAIVNGISNHSKAYQELDNARRLLGYEPQDSGDEWVHSYSEADQARFAELEWRRLSREELLHEWNYIRAKK